MIQEGWERLVERPDGAITALAIAPGAERGGFVFAGSPAGIRRSTDGGRTWTELDTGSSVSLVTSLAPSPNFVTDRTLFTGTANGCYRSTDGGSTWQLVLTGDQIFAVAVVPGPEPPWEATPAGPCTIFVGTEAAGALRSNDWGHTWDTANAGLLDLTILALDFSPEFARDGTGFVATESGIYRTRNGGKAWRVVDLPIEEPAVQCLGVSPNFGADQLLFAGTEEDGLLRSDDAGETWESVEGVVERSVTAVAFSSGGLLIAAATDDGVVVSPDGGGTWRKNDKELGPVLCLAFVPHEEREVLLAGLIGAGVTHLETEGAGWRVPVGHDSPPGADPCDSRPASL